MKKLPMAIAASTSSAKNHQIRCRIKKHKVILQMEKTAHRKYPFCLHFGSQRSIGVVGVVDEQLPTAKSCRAIQREVDALTTSPASDADVWLQNMI
jgi:hypothetical protein